MGSRYVAHRARAILSALEYQKMGAKTALAPRNTLTVEHVLPQSPEQGEWTHFTDQERAVYTYDLENLLLVDGPSGANDQLGNKEWPDKKALVKQWGTQTPLTTEALKFKDWNEAAIKKRRNALAGVAVKAWNP